MISQDSTFSANVRLQLHVGDKRIELGQLGPSFAILPTPSKSTFYSVVNDI